MIDTLEHIQPPTVAAVMPAHRSKSYAAVTVLSSGTLVTPGLSWHMCDASCPTSTRKSVSPDHRQASQRTGTTAR
jgi:hypothetical protein